MAHVSGAKPRMEAKRKHDEGVRNWVGGNAGVHEASVQTERTQLVEDIVEGIANGSFEMCKRSRMEMAGTGEMIPVRPYRDTSRWFTGEPAARSLPSHREHGAPFCQCGGSNRPREINVPNEMASVEGGAAEGGAAGQGAADGRFDYGSKVRNDNNSDLSLYLTGDMMRVLEDRKFAIELRMGPRESGRSVLLTCNAISDCT